jgi:hypothetical protein
MMTTEPQLLLVAAVAAVGVLHTLVPDHWAPIVAIARQRGWSQAETARAAALAGSGHVTSTLVIALIAWLAGEAVAQRFGNLVDTFVEPGADRVRRLDCAFGLERAARCRQPQPRAFARAPARTRTWPRSRPDRGGRVQPRSTPPGASLLARHLHTHRHGGGTAASALARPRASDRPRGNRRDRQHRAAARPPAPHGIAHSAPPDPWVVADGPRASRRSLGQAATVPRSRR